MSSPQPNTTKPQSTQFTNFLETLKEKGSLDTGVKPPFFEQLGYKKELEKRRIAEFHRHRNQEWLNLYSAKDKEVEKTIENIRFELQKLTKDIANFNNTFNQTVFTPIKKPGIYHQTFLEHLRQVISLIRQKVNDSNAWLSLYRQKALKHGHYWNQVGKSGSSFMLNNERQIATSVG